MQYIKEHEVDVSPGHLLYNHIIRRVLNEDNFQSYSVEPDYVLVDPNVGVIENIDVEEEPNGAAYCITVVGTIGNAEYDGPYLKLCIYQPVAGEDLV